MRSDHHRLSGNKKWTRNDRIADRSSLSTMNKNQCWKDRTLIGVRWRSEICDLIAILKTEVLGKCFWSCLGCFIVGLILFLIWIMNCAYFLQACEIRSSCARGRCRFCFTSFPNWDWDPVLMLSLPIKSHTYQHS